MSKKTNGRGNPNPTHTPRPAPEPLPDLTQLYRIYQPGSDGRAPFSVYGETLNVALAKLDAANERVQKYRFN